MVITGAFVVYLMNIAIVMGTRPEIIKLSPIIAQLSKNNSFVILSGQHYDYNLSLQFINELEIRKPDLSLNLNNADPPTQMGEMIIKIAKTLSKIKPDTVLIQGDTNTVLAASLAALKLNMPVCHVESGLRSFDWRMPEEHNRIEVDHISELLFAPTNTSKKNLINERVHGKIYVTGNTVIDAINNFADLSAKKSRISINVDDYILMTLHRAENVDNKSILSEIIGAVISSKENVIFPIHPRTLKRLRQFGLYSKLKQLTNVLLLEAVGYFDMLELMKKSSFIITDSGGVQEEATSPKIGKKVLVVRKTTDRPEAVAAGMSELVGTRRENIIAAIKRTGRNPALKNKSSPYGKGLAAKKIIQAIQQRF